MIDPDPAHRVGLTATIPVEILLAAGLRPVDLNNLFITSDGKVKILDFGLAKLAFPESGDRRIAILGAMRELGPGSEAYHRGLAAPLVAAGVQFALLVGEEMAPLAKALEGRIDFEHVAAHSAATGRLKDLIRPGDTVLVKGSNSVGLSHVVTALTNGDY